MKEKLKQLNDYEWVLPKCSREGMNVDAKVIASKKMLEAIEDEAIEQLTNVAMMPGVISHVIAMPDAHWGYGLPMGAVSAFDAETGVISSGLCGFDINCGINSISTNLTYQEIMKKQKQLMKALFDKIPVGVGSKGKLRLTPDQLDQVLTRGVNWAIENGYGTKEDALHMEESGCMPDGDPSKVSDLAKKRGLAQLGTLGAGNHFLEIQKVTEIYDVETAKKMGVNSKDQALIMLHCGSRGLGHQIASDYLKIQEAAVKKYNIKLPDQQLACAPVSSQEGQDYFKAMTCAVNYSFTNRLVMTQWIREAFESVFKKDWESLGINTLYGLCHNVVKLEEHTIEGKKKKVYVHRKGATRSFPGDPVLIAGSMGTASYILEGTEKAMEISFGSTCHGAGRAMSRNAAIGKYWGETIKKELADKGIDARSPHPKSLAEEAPGAYKDIKTVIDSVQGAGISKKVIQLEPVGVVKG